MTSYDYRHILIISTDFKKRKLIVGNTEGLVLDDKRTQHDCSQKSDCLISIRQSHCNKKQRYRSLTNLYKYLSN